MLGRKHAFDFFSTFLSHTRERSLRLCTFPFRHPSSQKHNTNREIAVNRQIRRQIVVGLIAILGFGVAQAGSGTGRITYFVSTTTSGGQEAFVVRFSTMNNVPGCSGGNRFAMSAANPNYKTTLAMLLGAWLSGNTTVFVHGSGSCTVYPGSEDLLYACGGGDPC